MGAVRTVGIFHLRGVEYVFSLSVHRARQRPFADSHAVATKVAVTWLIHGLDAQIAVLILKHGVGSVESVIEDTYDDALARIGLRQFLARAVDHIASLRHPSAVVRPSAHLGADVYFRYTLGAGQCLEFRERRIEQYQVALHQSHLCAVGLQLSGHLLGVSALFAVHEEVAALPFWRYVLSARRSLLGADLRLLLGHLGPVGHESLCPRCESTHK